MVQAAKGLRASGTDGLRVPPAPSIKSQASEPPVVTAVYTPDDLTKALDSGAEHIEILSHLDLTGWTWSDEDREIDDYNSYASLMEIPESVASFTVRRSPALHACTIRGLCTRRHRQITLTYSQSTDFADR